MANVEIEVAKAAEITQQLSQCDSLFQKGVLTAIEAKGDADGETALKCYENILEQTSSDSEISKKASEGLKKIEINYIERAEKTQSSEELQHCIDGLLLAKPGSTDIPFSVRFFTTLERYSR